MAKVSRRSVVTKGALAVAGAIVGLPKLAQAATAKLVEPPTPRLAAVDSPWLSRPHLTPHVGQVFHIDVPGKGWTAMRLAGVDDVTCAAAAGTVGSPHCFTAVFEAPASMNLRQGTYEMNHPAMGRFQLFLVAGGMREQRTVYTATVNRVTA